MDKLTEKITGFLRKIAGEGGLPKSFRKTLEKYGTAKISRMEIHREPISGVAEGLMNFITLGKWGDIRKNYDKIYHLYAVLHTDKGKIYLEKNQTPVLSPGAPSRGKDDESVEIAVPGIPVAEFIEKTMNRMGVKDYTTYDGFRLNCQNFISNHLKANGLGNSETQGFVNQDTKELVENTPSFSQWLGKKITDVAGYADRAVQELVHRRGGFHRPARSIGGLGGLRGQRMFR